MRFRGRRAKLEAAQAVVDCIEKRLAAGVTRPDEKDCRRNWLLYSFQRPLEDLILKAGQNALAYLILNLVVIGGGFATSGVSLAAQSGDSFDPSWLVFGIGLFVALAGGLSQQFRFGFRSSERRTLVLAFFNEGWHFALSTGAYVLEKDSAWALFGQRIDKLNERAAAVESIESELPKKPSSGQAGSAA
jgi:hypothetical protein